MILKLDLFLYTLDLRRRLQLREAECWMMMMMMKKKRKVFITYVKPQNNPLIMKCVHFL